MVKYKYIFKGINGGKYSYNSNNMEYAKQEIAKTYGLKKSNLKFVKKSGDKRI